MQLIRALPDLSDRPTAIAIGNFDGLHLGHQAVLGAMQRAAEAQQLVPSVLTFEPHPRRFFAPTTPPFRIERLSTKLARLRAAGIERVYMPRFDRDFSALTADVFLSQLLQLKMGARAVITGENFAFGRDRGGDIRTLRSWGAENGIEIIAVPPVRYGEAICSSSAIRAALSAGDVRSAAHLLGREYALSGRVVHGAARGRTIGFPTANIALPPHLKLPAFGVYAVRVELEDGTQLKGAANIGIKPTLSVYNPPTLEVHLFDFEHELYGKRLNVFFVDYLRQEQRFSGLEALKNQIALDCDAARAVLNR